MQQFPDIDLCTACLTLARQCKMACPADHHGVKAGIGMCTKLQSLLGVVLMIQHVVTQHSGQVGPQGIFAQVQLVQIDEGPVLV